jgi:CBS domain-containing membrane protein
LAGANLRDRLIAGVAAMAGVALTGLLSNQAAEMDFATPWLVAPIGASAVLVFAVPSSPLAQPWSVIGGNVISGLLGLWIGARIGEPFLACGIAVGCAIMVMSLLRCLHPPGGAVALMTAMMAHKTAVPLTYVLAPVGLNTAFLVALGWVYHRFSGHSYPHQPPAPKENVHETSDPPPSQRGFEGADLDAVLGQLRETYDIDREDLENILRLAETRGLSRRFGNISCGEIMSREVLCVEQQASMESARETFQLRALRCAPVIDAEGAVVGVLTPIGLAMDGGPVGAFMTPALFATPQTPAVELFGQMSDGGAHEAVIVDAHRRPVGLVTQTDLLALAQKMLARL